MLNLFDVIFKPTKTLFLSVHGLIKETAEQYIMLLYALATNFNCKALEHEIICDRLVLRIQDMNPSGCRAYTQEGQESSSSARGGTATAEHIHQNRLLYADAVCPVNHHRKQCNCPELQHQATQAPN